VKNLIAILLALLIGAACRWFEIPVPAPPRLFGALLILAVTVGYLLTDVAITRRTPPAAEVSAPPAQSPRP
jgi:XapX domain-containing protein